ncbi:hypothetical protein CMO89_00635 [Candidatus Woesearchaeota archaeon]|nr:hypothetical protein [Candidatus Woesearchaeota archaeon]|tara:strand:- start:9031 stop:9501 length:471 start_codon:yes stop_codon:yes gene_type:complete
MQITKLEEKDIEEISSLALDLYRKFDAMDEADKLDEPNFKEKMIEELKEFIQKDNNLLLTATEDGKIIGYIRGIIKTRHPEFKIKKEGYIQECYINQEHRNKGIGKSLAKQILKWFNENSITFITVSIYHSDIEANDFWKKIGFIEYNKTLKLGGK